MFTSANAVEVFANRMDVLDVHPNQLAAMRVAAVGSDGSRRCRRRAQSHARSGTATADALAATLRQGMRAGARVLYPRSASGRDVLPNELRTAGFDVLAINVYRTLSEPNVDQRVLDRVRRGEST